MARDPHTRPDKLSAHVQPSTHEVELLNIHSHPSVSSLRDSENSFRYDETRYEASIRSSNTPTPPAVVSHIYGPGDRNAGEPPSSLPPDASAKQPRPIHQQQYYIFRHWKWEIISMVLAIGLLVAIFVLISEYDTKRLDEWEFPINLSTLLALIATTFRIIVVVPVTSVIADSKWDWVGRDQVRFLNDVQALDEASRGPWGAISIIPMAAKGNIPALVAAITSILTLATAPFVQQALQTVECESPVQGRAAIPYAHFVPRSGGYTQDWGQRMPGDEGLQIMPTYDTELMIQSCQARPDAPDNQITATCTTGNCTFPDGDPSENGQVSHSSIGLCHRCVDTSSMLITDPDNIISDYQMGAELPTGEVIGGLYNTVVNSVVHKNLTWAGSIMDTPELKSLTNATLLNVTTLATNETDRNGTYLAVTCLLYTCVRSYQASMHEGELQERELPSIPTDFDLLSDPYRNTRRSVFKHLVGVKSPCLVDGQVFTAQNMSTAPNATQLSFCEASDSGGPCQIRNVSAPEACIYRQHGRFAHAMRYSLQLAFEGTCANKRGELSCRGSSFSNTTHFSSTDKWLLDLQTNTNNMVNGARSSFQRIDAKFADFAASMSRRYRTTFGAQTYALDGNLSPAKDLAQGEVLGQAWRTTTCNKAQLEWLALPTALAAITTALLVWVVARSWAQRSVRPVWKENLLPLILYKDRLLLDEGDRELKTGERGSTDDQRRAETPLMEVGQLSEVARKIPVRFQWNEWHSEEAGLKKRMRRRSVDSLLQQSG